MSVSDEFFKNGEEENSNTSLAKGLVILISVAILVFLVLGAYEKISIKGLDKDEEKILTNEEREKILNEIRIAQENSAVISEPERQTLIKEIQIANQNIPEMTESDRKKVIEEIGGVN